MTSVLVLNGPNLNLLGRRQPEVYGATTLPEIEQMCRDHVARWGWSCTCMQSNHEGALIDAVQNALGTHDGIILNAGGYTHTSIALMDAIASVELPVVEVHLSDIHARETFRHQSFIEKVAIAQVCGKGPQGYLEALDHLQNHLAMEGAS